MAVSNTAAYERIQGILDEGSFVEIGALVKGRNAGDGISGAGDGVVTGYGTIDDRLVYVYSQDPSYLAGSLGEMHARKISSLYRMALNMGAPVIAIVDCAGVRMDEGNDSLYSFGRIFAHQAKVSGVVPQITLVYGACGGGMAVSAGMSDFVIMEKENGRMFVNSPDAVTGNYTEKCDTSAAEFCAKSGTCDAYGTDEEIRKMVRDLVSMLPQNCETDLSENVTEDDLNRSVSGIESLKTPYEKAAQISDNGVVFEVKREYAASAFTGFIRLNGRTIGVVANAKDELCWKACEKITSFLKYCDAFSIPVLTLADVRGFARSIENEKMAAAKAAELSYTYASLTVPSVTIVTGKAYGTAGIAMGSKSLGTDLAYAWTGAKMGLMEKEYMDKLTGINADKDVYSAQYNAERGYLDDIFAPEETRQKVAASFEMLYTKDVAVVPRKHGTV
ncbi:MAG: carboxyl transferase [Lachnospiraceae bacterium]|nr:carboxyl transferase [Lachnospiraceae bacterium]